MSENSEICTMAELILNLGLGATLGNADAVLLELTKRQVEDRIRRFCRWHITQKQHVEFLPKSTTLGENNVSMLEKTSSNRAAWTTYGLQGGDILQLGQIYVSSISRLYEDTGAAGGQGSGDFPSGTLLTSGTDYYLDQDCSGEFSRTGFVYRTNGRSWSRKARTIKVVYTSGFTPTQLDEEYRDIKLACIAETRKWYKRAKSGQGADGTGVGEIKSEAIGGEYTVTYNTSESEKMGSLSGQTVDLLKPYRNYGNL